MFFADVDKHLLEYLAREIQGYKHRGHCLIEFAVVRAFSQRTDVVSILLESPPDFKRKRYTRTADSVYHEIPENRRAPLFCEALLESFAGSPAHPLLESYLGYRGFIRRDGKPKPEPKKYPVPTARRLRIRKPTQ